uniref:NADH dehydrogenase subunit 6 n=1 Tax=Osedax rubiplumus TaxID=283784 RepID=A0A6M4AFM9_OSERU|nr:NADH dehydrogenase subunit 6 [Osedax rubiplumus]QJQ26889.1 NADH dehydrogenase subunit 6 [Osedax rubiplumus]
MLSSLFILVILSASFLFPMMSTPLLQGLIILSTALLITGLVVNMSSWYAIILFLIYISGMLVTFAYFSASSHNKSMNQTPAMPMLAIILMSSVMVFLKPVSLNLHFFQSNMNSNYLLFFPMNSSIIVLLVSLLFFIMILVVSITSSNNGPMRPFMSYV